MNELGLLWLTTSIDTSVGVGFIDIQRAFVIGDLSGTYILSIHFNIKILPLAMTIMTRWLHSPLPLVGHGRSETFDEIWLR